MRAAAVRRVGRVSLLVHLHVEVPHEQWLEHNAEMYRHMCDPEVTAVVVWTDGQLTAVQRQSVADMHARLRREGRTPPPAFTFTDSTVSRGVMTALRWIGVAETRAFPKASMAATMAAAGFAPNEVRELVQHVEALERELRAG